VLVFLDAETVSRGRFKAGTADTRAAKTNADDDAEEEPPVRARKTKRSTRGPDLDSDSDTGNN
jgi:hypothetical protein